MDDLAVCRHTRCQWESPHPILYTLAALFLCSCKVLLTEYDRKQPVLNEMTELQPVSGLNSEYSLIKLMAYERIKQGNGLRIRELRKRGQKTSKA